MLSTLTPLAKWLFFYHHKMEDVHNSHQSTICHSNECSCSKSSRFLPNSIIFKLIKIDINSFGNVSLCLITNCFISGWLHDKIIYSSQKFFSHNLGHKRNNYKNNSVSVIFTQTNNNLI